MSRPTYSAVSRLRAAVCCVPALAAAGCQGVGADAALVAASPRAAAVKSNTAYSGAMACLDRLLGEKRAASGANFHRVPIVVATVPDATQRVIVGLRDMITNTVVRANEQSHYFQLLEGLNVGTFKQAVGGSQPQVGGLPIGDLKPEIFEIVGSLSQADNKIETVQTTAGVGVNSSAVGVSANDEVALFGLDLRISKENEVRYVVSNLMALSNTSKGVNADFKIGSFGLNFDRTLDRREGAHQAARTLVELSMVELLGRVANVPYQACLTGDEGNPQLLQDIAAWWRDSSAEARERYVLQRLNDVAYPGLVQQPDKLSASLADYQQYHGLAVTGHVDFETYASLVSGQLTAPGMPAYKPAVLLAPPPTRTGDKLAMRLDVHVISTTKPRLQLIVTLNRAAFLACYYRDEDGEVSQIYPNASYPDGGAQADLPKPIPDIIGLDPKIQIDHSSPALGYLCVATLDPGALKSMPPKYLPGGMKPVRADFPELLQAWRAQPDAGNFAFEQTTFGHQTPDWVRLNP